MNLRPSRGVEPEINLTPLIDVVFLLLIFFMVSTSFTHESEIRIDLPQASVEQVESQDSPIEISIDAQGRFYVNQQQVVNTRIDTLIKALKIALDKQQDPALIITADANTPHQAVVTAMDAARQLGIVRLSIATKQRQQQR